MCSGINIIEIIGNICLSIRVTRCYEFCDAVSKGQDYHAAVYFNRDLSTCIAAADRTELSPCGEIGRNDQAASNGKIYNLLGFSQRIGDYYCPQFNRTIP
jgi:hypothetical protein